MSTIHIERQHHLDPAALEALLQRWIESAERDFGLACKRRVDGETQVIDLNRAGAEGSLRADVKQLILHLELGFLFASFAPSIQTGIERKLDRYLGLDEKPADDEI